MQTDARRPLFALEQEFTEAYRRYEHEHPALREAMCLRVQYPAWFRPIQEGDRLAGRVDPENRNLGVGFLMSASSPDIGFVCDEGRLRSKVQGWRAQGELEGEAREHLPLLASGEPVATGDGHERELRELLGFWRARTTDSHFWARVISKRLAPIRRAMPDRLGTGDIAQGLPALATYGDRMATATLDFDKLLRLGLPGMFAEVEGYRAKAAREGKDENLYEGMRLCLELAVQVCQGYAAQAREQADAASDGAWRAELLEMAGALARIAVAPPQTLREAMQLFWLYAMLAQITNYGRMDVYLGDFLARDVDAGRLSEGEALSLVEALWRMIQSFCFSYSGSVVIGGHGRRNEANADRFALAAMEALKRTRGFTPALRLRLYEGVNPALLEKALEVIGEGLTFPVLVNDEVNVPGAQHAFGVTREEAEQYLISNCGDVSLDHLSFGSPNSFINLAKALEVTLHNGKDPVSGKPMGLRCGRFADFRSFEHLLEAYKRQVEFFVDAIADRNQAFNEVVGENPFLFVSMLYDDCLERGKGALAGGVRYLGGLLETYGNITTADSLTAIKELVYERKALTPQRLLAALEANFVGYEAERALMQKCPKFGNDDPAADAMAAWVNDHIFSYIWSQKDRTSLDHMLAEDVNAGGHVHLGFGTGATPDGRAAGTPLANSNNPTSGNDREGVTALLNSMAKLDVSFTGPGVFHSVHFDRSFFASSRHKIKALLEGFFANRGCLLQVSVLSRQDLEAALREPEQYQHLIVRVGGFSARFVELERDLQLDILRRTVY